MKRQEINHLASIIKNSSNILFFGGAGVSTESNIPDFRSAKGLYNTTTGHQQSPEEILSYQFFKKNPLDFYEFYKKNLIYPKAKPNLAHKALFKLEHSNKLKGLITQNIDGLHQLAGNKNVIELHGSVHRNYCMNCHTQYPLDYILKSIDIPLCDHCSGIIRPDIVLYGEQLATSDLKKASTLISQADVCLVGGTSLSVYPAAGLLDLFSGNHLIIINQSKTPYDRLASLTINGSIGKTLWDTVQLLNF